jgi:hypothetical protein
MDSVEIVKKLNYVDSAADSLRVFLKEYCNELDTALDKKVNGDEAYFLIFTQNKMRDMITNLNSIVNLFEDIKIKQYNYFIKKKSIDYDY